MRFVIDVNSHVRPYTATVTGPEPTFDKSSAASDASAYEAAHAAFAAAWLKGRRLTRADEQVVPILPAVAAELSKAEARMGGGMDPAPVSHLRALLDYAQPAQEADYAHMKRGGAAEEVVNARGGHIVHSIRALRAWLAQSPEEASADVAQPMEVPDAVEHAKRDVATITARLYEEGTDEGLYVLVDGSQYSPSWRVLPGGSAVWETTTDLPAHEHAADLIEAYEETLDHGIEALDLYWHEGCLWADNHSGPR